jgi:hypothetical protein
VSFTTRVYGTRITGKQTVNNRNAEAISFRDEIDTNTRGFRESRHGRWPLKSQPKL